MTLRQGAAAWNAWQRYHEFMSCSFHLVDEVRNARSDLLTVCQDVSHDELHRGAGRSALGGWQAPEALE